MSNASGGNARTAALTTAGMQTIETARARRRATMGDLEAMGRLLRDALVILGQATEFRVPCPGHPDPDAALLVQSRGDDRWVVYRPGRRILAKHGFEWVSDRQPSSMDDDFTAATRYSLDEALALAVFAGRLLADEAHGHAGDHRPGRRAE